MKFSATLDIQNDLGLGFWQDSAPKIRGIDVTVVVEQRAVHAWAQHFVRPAQSVDQRTVFARWLELYARMGGNLIIDELSRENIDDWAAEHELTVVTHGAHDLMECFPSLGRLAPADPVRRTAVLYLSGVRPRASGMGSCFVLPGLGEIVSYTALSGRPGAERACEVLLFEAVPGDSLDVFGVIDAPYERLRRAQAVLEELLPEGISHRYRYAELIDPGATMTGDVIPRRRIPVGVLPSGRLMLGGGDAVRERGLGGAQGVNNAVHCALRYAERILTSAGGVFDRDWMWRTARPCSMEGVVRRSAVEPDRPNSLRQSNCSTLARSRAADTSLIRTSIATPAARRGSRDGIAW
ncbi:styrene monooxygenase/indole monooxygenase family protein [Nocardia brasiliensis]|nr:styrene monooxygenase/indole monooxygenase family protein [Nocardia brasiliensis]